MATVACTACRFVRWKKTSYESLPVCVNPQAATPVGDSVYGFTTRGWQYCEQMREEYVGKCGPEGRLWGPREPRSMIEHLTEWWLDPHQVRRSHFYLWSPSSHTKKEQ
jgi:hypothetical protein